jgi:hypothetical protein
MFGFRFEAAMVRWHRSSLPLYILDSSVKVGSFSLGRDLCLLKVNRYGCEGLLDLHVQSLFARPSRLDDSDSLEDNVALFQVHLLRFPTSV